jgi:hypothetical protein
MNCKILFNVILIGISLSVTAQNQDTATSCMIYKSYLVSNMMKVPSSASLDSFKTRSNLNSAKLFSTLSLTFATGSLICFITAISYASRSGNMNNSPDARDSYKKQGQTFATIGGLLVIPSLICWQAAIHSPYLPTKKTTNLKKDKINSDNVYMSIVWAGPALRFQIRF